MRSLAFVLLGGFLSPGPFVPKPCLAADRPASSRLPAGVEKQVQEIISSRYPYETDLGPGMAKGYRTLLEQVGPDGIRALQGHVHDGIAIQAAWEEVRLTVPGQEPHRPDRDKLTWFLGFLEGRARVKAPRWWSEVLLGSNANSRDNIYPGEPKERPYHDLGLDNALGPRDSTLHREGSKAVMQIDKSSVTIPEELLRKSDDGKVWCNVSGLMSPSRCYVAIHDSVGLPFKLFCIDRATEKVLWRSEAFGTWWGMATGQHHMWVAVTEQHDRIVLFGAAATGMHVEAFRPEDGKNLFRFSTSY